MNLPIELTKIIFRNFMSFGNQYTEIDLTYPGSTLINGWNKDTNSNNGAGKCVSHDTLINIRNKSTGEIISIPIGDFYEMVKADVKD